MIGILHLTQNVPGPGVFEGNVTWFTDTHPEWCPNTLIDPRTRQRWRPIPAGVPSKALVNLPGGVETNNRPGGVHQVEIVGRTPDCAGYSAEWYAVLNEMLEEEAEYAGIYNLFWDSPDRMTLAEWMTNLGPIWYQHKHVPENNHTDCGTLRLDLLGATVITPEDAKAIAAAVWNTQVPLIDDDLVGTHDFTAHEGLTYAHKEAKTIRIKYGAPPVAANDLQTVPDALLLAEVARRFRV